MIVSQRKSYNPVSYFGTNFRLQLDSEAADQLQEIISHSFSVPQVFRVTTNDTQYSVGVFTKNI